MPVLGIFIHDGHIIPAMWTGGNGNIFHAPSAPKLDGIAHDLLVCLSGAIGVHTGDSGRECLHLQVCL